MGVNMPKLHGGCDGGRYINVIDLLSYETTHTKDVSPVHPRGLSSRFTTISK